MDHITERNLNFIPGMVNLRGKRVTVKAGTCLDAS
jgi:hypothetical protein